MNIRITFSSLLILCLIPVFILGCTQTESPTSTTTESPTNATTETTLNTSSTPTPPIIVEVSFPNGAPELNQTAELTCKVITHGMPANNMSLVIELPAGFERINGELSWNGTIPKDVELEVLSVTIKSVQTGNWRINVDSFLDPEENDVHGTGHYPVFVSVYEDSAEWGTTAPWLSDPTTVSPTTGNDSTN